MDKSKEVKQLLEVLVKIDYLFQEGVLFSDTDITRLDLVAQQLTRIVYDIRFQKAYKNG